ncbi:MAG: cation:proton antiporter [Gemmatimonadaceae bacterium]|nr:cation:proton antiporter [Gemmatimonadaceae bacterium]
MIGAAVAAVLAVFGAGSSLVAPVSDLAAVATSPAPAAAQDTLLHVLLALVIVIIAARLCGALCQRLHQPAVIGEVIAGILLGPSLLGRIAPGLMNWVLPAATAPYLSIIAQIGVILFMFLVGLQLDLSQLTKKTHATIAISHASILVPFVLGCVLALWLYPRYATGQVSFTVFALFVGVSLSVTAFPVLARILTDRGLQSTYMGTVALTCAAVDDATAWCLLAVVVAIAKADASSAVRTLAMTAVYLVVMLWVVRPLVTRAIRSASRRAVSAQAMMSFVVVALLISTLATEAAGIHAIFGAFLLGAIIPHASELARDLQGKLHDIVIVLFLPAFFAFTGLRTEIGLVSTPTEWFICAVITLTASLGKFGGTFAAAKVTGFMSRDAVSLGILMNTRGLMELIVLNLGLDLGILSPTLFTMLVIMAVLTTLATTPVLDLVTRRPVVNTSRLAVP